jgi:ATPase family associated with various cellular activities (AAA)
LRLKLPKVGFTYRGAAGGATGFDRIAEALGKMSTTGTAAYAIVGKVSEPGLDTHTANELARALKSLMRAAEHRLASDGQSQLVKLITEHLGCGVNEILNVRARWGDWEHANLQLAADAYLAEYSPDATWVGIAGLGHGHHDLIDMLAMAMRHGEFEIGAVDYATVSVSPDRSIDAVQFGLVPTVAPDGSPVMLAIHGAPPHMEPVCQLQVLTADRAAGTATRERFEQLMDEHDAFRGKVLTFGFSEHRGNRLVTFQPRPQLSARDVILPPGVLESVERHVVLPGGLTAALRSAGQHLKRGLLLHGPPGAGKTHTVRYLMSRLVGSTVIVVSGPALVMIGHATALARRLQPSVVVIEDVDLIAQDRAYGPAGQPLLFQLLNEMEGIGSDIDVTFVLTTNRVDVLERALIDRPGRIDLAVHIPRPDAECRRRLLNLYASGVTLDLPDPSRLVAATEGVTASFIRELVRRAVLRTAGEEPVRHDERPARLDEAALQAALNELADERNALTRSLLGGRTDEPGRPYDGGEMPPGGQFSPFRPPPFPPPGIWFGSDG